MVPPHGATCLHEVIIMLNQGESISALRIDLAPALHGQTAPALLAATSGFEIRLEGCSTFSPSPELLVTEQRWR